MKTKFNWRIPCVIALIIAVLSAFLVAVLNANKPALVYDDPTQQFFGVPVEGNDYDNDVLDNETERALGTDLYNADTDGDGLGDYYESKNSKTDPCKVDTDGDGASDYVELKAQLDPLKASTDGTTPDAERKFAETYSNDNIQVDFAGNANVYSVYCAPLSVPGLDKTPGVMSEMIEVYAGGEMPDAKLSIRYNEKDITARGGTEQTLAIFRFTKEVTFEKVESSAVDAEKNTVMCLLKDSGRYVLCDMSVTQPHHNQIMLLIDNSGSMFSPEVSSGSPGNDVDFKRLDMAKNIIHHISTDTSYGIGKFTGTYTPLCPLGTDTETLMSTIDGIRDTKEVFNGTFIATSIIKSLDNFTAEHSKDRKFIIILTDGESTEHSGILGMLSGNPTEHDAVKKCNEANVTVITIALGNQVNADYLQTISNGTGGAYIYANNADALEDVYDAVFKSLIYSSEDVNRDGTVDSYIIADSGFDIQRNAFCFENLPVLVPNESIQHHGLCYGMATLAQAYYRGINLGHGDAYTADAGGDQYSFAAYDVQELLKSVSNLRDLPCDIAEKWTTLHLIPSQDRYVCKDNVLRYKPELLKQYPDEYFTVKTYESKGTFGKDHYEQAEMLYIDIEKYVAQSEKRDDMEIVKTIYWLWGAQAPVSGTPRIKFQSYDLRNDWGDVGTEQEFAGLADRLRRGIPLTISYSSPAGGHAINAMRLLRNTDNPLVYYLECYDNNDKEFPYVFKIERSDIDFWTKTNVSNWDENYCYRTYMFNNGKWEGVSLSFEEILP